MTFLIVVAALSLLPNRAEQSAPEVFPGDGAKSLGAEHVHDPTVIEFGGRFFCFSTSGNGFTVVRSSRDLRSWETLGPIFDKQPEWLAKRYDHRSIWAPDVLKVGTGLRMYYSASLFGKNESVIGLAECAEFDPLRPLEGWVDKGLVIESKPGRDDFNAIDAETIVDDSGRHWMFFGSYWDGIHVVELNATTGKLKSSEGPDLIKVASNTSERGNPLEGAAVIRRGSYYYLFVSYGLAAQGIRSTYRIMVGRSKSPTGPFVDRENKPMTDGGHVEVLKTSPPMVAAGHCDVLQLKDGRWVMPYHYYDSRRYWNREWGMPTLQVRELLWSPDDWPLPGMPLEEDPPRNAGTSLIGDWVYQSDFGQPRRVEFRSNGSVSDGRLSGTWRTKGAEIVARWPKPGAVDGEWVDTLQLAYQGAYLVGRNQSGSVIRAVRRVSGKD